MMGMGNGKVLSHPWVWLSLTLNPSLSLSLFSPLFPPSLPLSLSLISLSLSLFSLSLLRSLEGRPGDRPQQGPGPAATRCGAPAARRRTTNTARE